MRLPLLGTRQEAMLRRSATLQQGIVLLLSLPLTTARDLSAWAVIDGNGHGGPSPCRPARSPLLGPLLHAASTILYGRRTRDRSVTFDPFLCELSSSCT